MSTAEVRHMRTDEVLEAVEARRIPVVPVATLETHDPHLPVDVDVVCAEEVVLRAARERPDLVLAFPPIAYGYTEHTLDFPGGYSIRPQILLEFYYDIGESIVQNGFRKLLFLNGHGSNVTIMNLASRLVTLRTPGLCAATSWWELCRESRARLRESEFPGGMAHACEFETSLMLYLRPESVRSELVRREIPEPRFAQERIDLVSPGLVAAGWQTHELSSSGVLGAPDLATAEKGKRLFEACVEGLSRVIEELRAAPLPEGARAGDVDSHLMP
jgi:creatinine amidohydrolase